MTPDLLGGLDLGVLAWAENQTDAQETRSEVAEVSARIAGSMVEVLAGLAGQLLAGQDERRVFQQLEETARSLSRLAGASGEEEHRELVLELVDNTHRYGPLRGQRGARRLFLDQLRDWLPRYGSYLGGDAEARLLELVEFGDIEAIPLYAELQNLRGIGPRRLRRLYGAGFHEPVHLMEANPEELAEVTGLPVELSRRVIEQTHSWVEARRRRAITDMQTRIQEFRRVLDSIEPSDERELGYAAMEAMRAMRQLLREHEEVRDDV